MATAPTQSHSTPRHRHHELSLSTRSAPDAVPAHAVCRAAGRGGADADYRLPDFYAGGPGPAARDARLFHRAVVERERLVRTYPEGVAAVPDCARARGGVSGERVEHRRRR